ncbi:Whole genome shotgun sequence [Vibrio owensii]|uniref:Whole genome shotgun sequence n=1 Tax=Vibrio owensii TaxID=696485 RepID=A0AAU9PZ16_9VIBR|nr:Whole genome shotgun sequence [Vibrio owensii]
MTSKTTETMNDLSKQVSDLLTMAKEQEWDDQTFADNFAALEGGIDDKLMAYRRYMDKLETAAKLAESEKKVYAEQAKPYADRAKSLKDERSRMTHPLLNLFQILNIEKMKGAYGTFFIKKNPPKLKFDEAKLPERLRIREVRFVPDVEAIQKEVDEALEQGKDVDFAWYETPPKQVVLRK